MQHPINEYDWYEDAKFENGNYQNECCICHVIFIGHKRRVVCKKCFLNNNPTYMGEDQQLEISQ